MENQEWIKAINWELERQVMIFISNESIDGLFELPSEYHRYNLTFPQRIYLTYTLLFELLNEGLISLEEYKTRKDKYPTRIVESKEYLEILDNHYSWYPSDSIIYSIGTTERGIEYINGLSEAKKVELNERLFGV
jgi:hypothetical protein